MDAVIVYVDFAVICFICERNYLCFVCAKSQFVVKAMGHVGCDSVECSVDL